MNEYRLKSEKENIHFFDLFVLIYFFIALSASTIDIYLYLTLALCLLLILWLGFWERFIVRFSDKRVLCVLFFLSYILVTGFPVGGALYTAKKVGAAIIEFSPILVFNYYRKHGSKRSRKFVTLGLILILVFYMIQAYFTYTSLGVSARRMANHTGDYGNLSIGGGYSLAYAVSLLGVYLVDSIKNKRIRGKFNVVMSLGVIVLSVMVVYETLSTITLLACVLGIVVAMFIPSINPHDKGVNNIMKPALVSILVVGLSFALSSVIGDILVSVASNNSTTMGKRLFDLGNLLNGAGSGEYTAGRMSIPFSAFGTFLKNPILGISYLHGNGFYKASLFGAGNHCEWFDALCNYGVVGGLPYLYIYFASVKQIYKTQTRNISFGLIITVFIMGFFNPFRCIQSNTILMLLIPLLALQQNEPRSIE